MGFQVEQKSNQKRMKALLYFHSMAFLVNFNLSKA